MPRSEPKLAPRVGVYCLAGGQRVLSPDRLLHCQQSYQSLLSYCARFEINFCLLHLCTILKYICLRTQNTNPCSPQQPVMINDIWVPIMTSTTPPERAKNIWGEGNQLTTNALSPDGK